MKETTAPTSTSNIPKVDYNKEVRQFANQTLGLNNIALSQELRPTLVISHRMHQYIKSLHNLYPTREWMGVCRVIQDTHTKYFHLIDIVHPEQKAHGTECEATDEGMDQINDWIDQNLPGTLHEWPLTLHSHHNMGVFWSSTDDKARLNQNDGRPYSMNVVTAYDQNSIQYKGCINFYQPYNIELDFNIIVDEDPIYEQLQQQYQDEVDRADEDARQEVLSTDPAFNTITELLGEDILPTLQQHHTSDAEDVLYKKIFNRYFSKIKKPELLQELEEWIYSRQQMLEEALLESTTNSYEYPYTWKQTTYTIPTGFDF